MAPITRKTERIARGIEHQLSTAVGILGLRQECIARALRPSGFDRAHDDLGKRHLMQIIDRTRNGEDLRRAVCDGGRCAKAIVDLHQTASMGRSQYTMTDYLVHTSIVG